MVFTGLLMYTCVVFVDRVACLLGLGQCAFLMQHRCFSHGCFLLIGWLGCLVCGSVLFSCHIFAFLMGVFFGGFSLGFWVSFC